MNDNEVEKLKRQLTAHIEHQTRWVRRIPTLLGVLGIVLALIGYWRSVGPLTALGACISIVGFGAQAVLWVGLHDEDKR
ncbi:hypothetical protein OU5_P0328 (plasmid) [Pseudomonas mandelii JR-1]|uniref:Uncharacterized protein n=2 Tax=Pseudomonas TaxID=286 RepID=A0A024ELW5_9PSED|nr:MULTISPECIES: hypothetical protein [Pseudomonas]AHZ73580.1 hypothetical protein OU5_P0328 [Pseudomonas mandelii JR-1]MBC2383762.1 hypothetical protein [Pseudomonas cremoris]